MQDSRLFELARSGRRLPHWLVVLVMSVVFILAAQVVGGIGLAFILLVLNFTSASGTGPDTVQAVRRLLAVDSALEQTLLLVCLFGPIFILLWVWLALVEKRGLWTLGLERQAAAQKYLRGLGVGLVMFGLSVGISALPGYMAPEQTGDGPRGLAALGGVALVFLGWMVQGAAEEALARGWILPTLGARYRPWIGVAASAGLFAVFHSFNPHLGPIAVLNLFLFGLFTALYALSEGSIWGVCGVHTAWNWAQGNLFGLQVSGLASPAGTLFDLMETGPDLITGGAFGPEGGLAVTAVLLLASFAVWKLAPRLT